MKDGLDELEQRFGGRGYVFRACPNARCECLRYQAGVIERHHRVVSQKIGTGGRRHEVDCETFRLVAFGATASELAEKLSRLPPPYRELLDA